MSVVPVLDTHIWVWWMLGDSKLKGSKREYLDALPPGNRPVLSDISLWEVGMLVEMGRLDIGGDIESWLEIAASPATVSLQPVTPAIIAEMNRLPSGFHRDPANRLIVATARVLGKPLATVDDKIRKALVVRLWK